MYIYQIENILNHKKYVGSTNNPDRRMKEHFNAAIWPSCCSYNYPLQKAIRKYGQENFIFSILEECDLDKTPERERFYIEKLNTLVNSGYGYNQTLETGCALRDANVIKENIERTGKKCALVDENNIILKTFCSYHDAARETYGGNEASPIRRVCKGETWSINGYIFRDLDKNGQVIIPQNKTRKRKTAIIGIKKDNPNDVVYYESISEAARVEGVARGSISKCINGSTRYSQVGGRVWRKESDINE